MASLTRETTETSKTVPIANVAAAAEEEEEPLPADLVDSIYYITSDSWAVGVLYRVAMLKSAETFFLSPACLHRFRMVYWPAHLHPFLCIPISRLI
jgi:hypothetical protein